MTRMPSDLSHEGGPFQSLSQPENRSRLAASGVLSLEPAAILAVERLLAVYGHVIDDGNFDALSDVFTDDARFDGVDFGMGDLRGIAEIRAAFAAWDHPRCHMTLNVVVDGTTEGAAARSKWLVLLKNGKVVVGTYEDAAVPTDRGWRLAYRRALLQRPPRPADPL
jgi:hypothetical protein